jgi:DNA gyrase subunit A
MQLGLVHKVDIDHEMQQSYLDYAMSVIVARALPDARDGLKPVQRRILYAMYDMGLRPDSSYKKSARIVGEVLGKYHPHGDMAVYEAMARLAQDFTIRYPLVEGQGNFGSVDGDPPAAMRYTEARLTSFALELLNQIDQDTVAFLPNFDATLVEPLVLPAAVPNLLVNGSSGIAVGMATNIPPHNLGEVIDALTFMLRQWEHLDDLSVQDLMKHIKGPDFPTGGIILQEDEQNELLAAYATGRGRITVRGRVVLEEMARGRSRVIITQLPYLTNKSSLIEKIAEMAREGQLEEVADLRDESDRQGLRVVIELKQGAEIDQVLRSLYQHTPLQTTFGVIMLALVDGEPRLLTLKQALRVYLEHRLEVVRRRSEFELARARKRVHILEGLRVAISHLDEVIALIRAAPDADTARERLRKRFKLSEEQAQAILDMPLKRLAALERKKVEQEYKELLARIKELEALLRSPRKLRAQVENELLEVRQRYADARRTEIRILKAGESAKTLLTAAALTAAREVWIGVTEDGSIARVAGDKPQRPAGQQAARWMLKTTTHHTLYLVCESGKAAAVSVETLPEVEKFSEGVSLHKIAPLGENERLAGVFALSLRDEENVAQYVMTVSRAGMVKKSAVSELPGASAHSFTLTKLNTGDALQSVLLTSGEDEVVLATAFGMTIHFSEGEVRPMGLIAAGVNGIKLRENDWIAGAEAFHHEGQILLLASDGRAWRFELSEIPVQGRYGQGVITCKLGRGARLIGTLGSNRAQMGIVHFAKATARLLKMEEVALSKRQRSGQPVIEVKAADSITALTPVLDSIHPVTERSRKVVRKAKGKQTDDVKKGAAVSRTRGRKEKAPVTKPTKSAKKSPSSAGHSGSSGAKETPVSEKISRQAKNETQLSMLPETPAKRRRKPESSVQSG